MFASPTLSTSELIIRFLHQCPYEVTHQAMQNFTHSRTADTQDEIWLLEHDAIFTQGQAGKAEHLLDAGDIPVVQSDRGGQITYHALGQLIVYFLIDLKRKKIGVRELVTLIETICIDLLAKYKINAHSRANAPGIYVNEKKIGSLGLRVRRGCSFHGLALNINMDLSPFLRINPCGYAGLEMTQTSELQGPNSIQEAIPPLITCIKTHLGYQNTTFIE